MAKTLSIVTNGNKGGIPVQNQGMKLSKMIAIDKIEEHERFKELYTIDEDLLKRITDDIIKNKFDASQPVHIWVYKDTDGNEHFYLLDGYTRIRAAKAAGLAVVPYFEHSFDSFEEAHRYALHLQVDRRNLSGTDLLKNIELLMGSEYIQNMKGNKNFAIGELLGVSEKTVERANFVNKNASEDQKQAIKAGEATVNSTCDDIKAEKKKAKQQIAVEDDSDFSNTESSDDISEALGDNSGTPSGLNFNHSDGIERPSNKLSGEEDSARTSERRSAYESGFVDGFKQAAAYIFFQVKKDKFIEEIEKEFDGAKKTFAKLSSFVPKEIEIPEEEYDGKELTFDDSNENEMHSDNENEAFDLGIDEE